MHRAELVILLGGAEDMVFQEAIREVEGVKFKGIIYSPLFLQEAGSKI